MLSRREVAAEVEICDSKALPNQPGTTRILRNSQEGPRHVVHMGVDRLSSEVPCAGPMLVPWATR